MTPGIRGIFQILVLVALLPLCISCAGSGIEPYSPHENLLSIAAEFELLDSRDPYRDPPAKELTGQNIARVTLVRLANYEALHPERFTPEIEFLRARAWERLGDYDSALRAWRLAAAEPALAEEANRRAALLQRVVNAREMNFNATAVEELLTALRAQSRTLKQLAGELDDQYYASLAEVEAEHSDVRYAELVALNRWVIPDGENRAIEAARQVVATHTGSHRALEHALRLARLYRDFALEEMRLNPPHTAAFDREQTLQYVDESLDIFYRVSQADGREERLLAARELDAMIALKEILLERSQ